MLKRRPFDFRATLAGMLVAACLTYAAAADEPAKPNILVIFGDDIGWFNVSSYSGDLMGVPTPNIDRISKEGLRLSAFYAQPSCTAGRAAFITGQLPVRTGLTTVGTPGSPFGLQKEDITLAEVLKTKGYATAQFGKNHLGDLEDQLPQHHGFDEFFGNLYHLNANEDLEDPDRPTNPEFRKKFDPRGVISGTADGPTIDEGPLTTKRMETIDDEILAHSFNFLERCAKDVSRFSFGTTPRGSTCFSMSRRNTVACRAPGSRTFTATGSPNMTHRSASSSTSSMNSGSPGTP